MGIDWFRMRQKPGAGSDELNRLVHEQSAAFQAMVARWDHKHVVPGSDDDGAEASSERAYLESSKALRGLLEFPEFDDAQKICPDYPDLSPCWRLNTIAHCTVFPPEWRLAAYRTIMPTELGSQIEAWTHWLSAVAERKHVAYLRRLHVYETTMQLHARWCELKDHAESLDPQEIVPGSHPDWIKVREQILRDPMPALFPAPIWQSRMDMGEAPNHEKLMAPIGHLLTRIREWADVLQDSSWCCEYEDEFPTFENYFTQIRMPWLLEFLDWAKRCHALGMGLFLDY